MCRGLQRFKMLRDYKKSLAQIGYDATMAQASRPGADARWGAEADWT
jgi:hypothetical protein